MTDVYGKLLEVGDRVLILSPFLYEDVLRNPNLECTGVVFGIASCFDIISGEGVAGATYVVHINGPIEEGWENWGSATAVLVPGINLMKYYNEWSYT